MLLWYNSKSFSKNITVLTICSLLKVVYNVNDKASYEEALLMIQEIQEKNSRSVSLLTSNGNKCKHAKLPSQTQTLPAILAL